jgi:glycosyltransferase involved in cell wall biosynthesis
MSSGTLAHTNPPRIALVMIVRNEAATIARCLLSARDFVDEMILLDTGSTDDTVAIASGLGAKVMHWAWRDDFAAARNEALAHSQAEWNLVLDGDEWIAGDGAILRQAIQEQAAEGWFVGRLPVKSQLEAAGEACDIAAPPVCFTSWLPRLLPGDVRYTGRIHEQPQSDLPRRDLALEIGHDGYLPDQKERKKGRNRKLLLLALAEAPENAYLNYHLGKDYDVYSQFAEAIPCYELALRSVEAGQGWRIDLIVRILVCLRAVGHDDLAYQFAQDEMQNCQQSPDFFYLLAHLNISLARKNPEQALGKYLPMARLSLQFCLNLGERPDIEGAVFGRGSHAASELLALIDQSRAQ